MYSTVHGAASLWGRCANGDGMKRLNGMDAVVVYGEAPNLHMHTLKVAIMHAERSGTSFTFESFRETFEQRLRYLDPLRWRLVETPWRLHRPLWVEDCEVDLDYHLRRVKVPSPGGRRELVSTAMASANDHRSDGSRS
jgi:diacylglycerol O-acyltransferase / wax synthase